MRRIMAKIGITDRPSLRLFLRQVAGFILVGATNVAVHYGIYYLLLAAGVHYLPANAVGFLASVANAFAWNKLFVFRRPDAETPSDADNAHRESAGQLLRMLITKLSYLVLNTGLLALLVQRWGVSEKIAPVWCLLLLNPYSFLMTKLWVFRDKDAAL